METTNISILQLGTYYIFNIINKRPVEEKVMAIKTKTNGHLKHD